MLDRNFYQTGRGAQSNPNNEFFEESLEIDPEFLEFCQKEGEDAFDLQTEYIDIFPKKIVNKVNSPDVPFAYSMNPYQGCEHGCIYCYARNTHQYWGYSAGLDFERKILVKKAAPDLLRQQLSGKNWKPSLIMLSGNTDCYQPVEKKLKITQKLLQVCSDFNHPVGLITKNSLLLRDIDLLASLSERNILRTTISFTSLSEETRRKMEPRTSSVKNKLKAIELLRKAGVDVGVNLAPIVPGINDFEIPDLLKAVSDAGARSANYIMVRLNGPIGLIFEDWVRKAYPDRANKILHQIEQLHGGKRNSSDYTKRMRGKGALAEQIRRLFQIHTKKYFEPYVYPAIDLSLFDPIKRGQFRLF